MTPRLRFFSVQSVVTSGRQPYLRGRGMEHDGKKHASQPILLQEGYVVTINVRERDAWKIRMLYWSYK
jgi:hypothetical protein